MTLAQKRWLSKAISNLRKLILFENKITDIGAGKLKALSSSKLEWLRLGNDNISDIGVEKLAEAYLFLSWNYFS